MRVSIILNYGNKKVFRSIRPIMNSQELLVIKIPLMIAVLGFRPWRGKSSDIVEFFVSPQKKNL